MNDTDDVDENAGVSVQQFVVFFLKLILLLLFYLLLYLQLKNEFPGSFIY